MKNLTAFTSRFLLSLIIMIASFSILTAQETTELRPFNTIKVMGRVEVELIKSDREAIEIRAFGDDEDRLKVSQQHKTLKISTLRSLIDEDLEIDIKIYYINLEALYVAGGAELEIRDTIKTEELYVRAGSGSEVYLEVLTDRLDVQAAEGAHLTLRGSSRELRAGANTGGILDGHRLRAEKGKLRAGTGGEVSATVNQHLSARANTGGIIRYAGNPEIEASTFLGGEVKPLLRKK